MIKNVKQISVGALTMMILPLLIWISGWYWQPEISFKWLKGWYWLTQTVNQPWSTITSALLIIWFLCCLHFCPKISLRLAIILMATLLIGQGVKFFIKEQVQEPRPYVVWLEQCYEIDCKKFYLNNLKKTQCYNKTKLKEKQIIPLWLQNYWLSETSFSFPSGHTIFAASWALLAVGLLWPNKHKISTIFLMIWANGVIISRILLGMHWPWDVIMGITVSGFIIIISCWFVQQLVGEKLDISTNL